MQYKTIILLLVVALCSIATMAQEDTTFNRVVTIEREYQIEYQEAAKIQLEPQMQEEEQQDTNLVMFSGYSTQLLVDYNPHPLKPAKTNFSPQSTLKGLIEGGIGHRNSHLAFAYQLTDKEKMAIDFYANHDGYWGRDALAQSQLGMQIIRNFTDNALYFGIEGNNEFFTYYGHYYDGDKGIELPLAQIKDHQNLWKINAHIGLKTTNTDPIQFDVQTGYQAFITGNYYVYDNNQYIPTNNVVENQIRTHGKLWWESKKDANKKAKMKAGVQIHMQNSLYASQPSDTINYHKHALRIEPFFDFKRANIRIHAGVNLDLNFGTGTQFSAIEDIAFAPSPNVEFEWNMMNNVFNFYTLAKGSMGVGSLEEYLSYNRYLNIEKGRIFNTPRTYTPVDAQLGFKIRPTKTMLIDIYGGYAYIMGACNMYAHLDSLNKAVTDYTLTQTDYQRWKVGASVHYHYRDVVDVNVSGNFYAWDNRSQTETTVYDRPVWDVKARVDVHIDQAQKWTFYSDNYIAGKSIAQTSNGDIELKPHVSLNLGGQYAINNWLLVYLQLNNYLNYKNDIFYGYQSQGCHFIGGVKYKF